MNDRIANLVKAVREAEPRETLEKFDVGKIERSNETLVEFVARIERVYDEGDKTQDKVNFIAHAINEFLETRQKSYDTKYRRTSGNARKRATYAASQDEFDAIRLSRPIIAIDSEGQDYDGDDIMRNGVLYKKHGTYLWCASSGDATKETHILTDRKSNGLNKIELDAVTILDWLLSLPEKYAPVTVNQKEQKGAIFIMFGSGYDITQLLAKTSLETAHKIVKRTDPDEDEIQYTAPEFWRDYAFSYIKGKWLDIWKLRDHNAPYIAGTNKLDVIQHVKLYDTFGMDKCA